MSDELTLKIGRRGAALLLEQLRPRLFHVDGDSRAYLAHFMRRLQDFIDRPPPKHVNMRVISVGGVPAAEYYGKDR